MTHEPCAVVRVIETDIDGVTNIMEGQDDDERHADNFSDGLLDNLKMKMITKTVSTPCLFS